MHAYPVSRHRKHCCSNHHADRGQRGPHSDGGGADWSLGRELVCDYDKRFVYVCDGGSVNFYDSSCGSNERQFQRRVNVCCGDRSTNLYRSTNHDGGTKFDSSTIYHGGTHFDGGTDHDGGANINRSTHLNGRTDCTCNNFKLDCRGPDLQRRDK